MTQEDKELLLKDICARLPHGIKCAEVYPDNKFVNKWDIVKISKFIEDGIFISNCEETYGYVSQIENIKPYLFPLSSMTEEQYNSLYESGILDNCSHSYEYVNPHIHGVSFIFKEFKTYSLELIEWLNKNHFDYRGLIPLGLANDATNLNIY